MVIRPSRSRWLRHASVLLALLCWSGCRPTFEASDEAVPLPLLERDPAENGIALSQWPAWRGANGCGIASGGSPALSFSDTEGVRWKVAVPGRGNSSPVVWDNYVLLTSAIDDTDPPTLAVVCFDRTSGKQLWQSTAGAARGRTHEKNGYASASVTTDGTRIIAFFGSAGLFCCDFAGKPLWHADLGDLHHIWGTASSPVLCGDNVIQVCDYDGDSYLAAFDKQTGQQIWRTARPSRGCWSTPVFVPADAHQSRRTEMVVNGTQYSSGSEGLILAYDPEDGRELWRVRGTTQWVTPTPVVCHGLVYCVSGRNGPVMAIRPGGAGDVTETHVLWKASRGGSYVPSPLAYRNRLFVLLDEGSLASYDAGSGRRVWTTKLPGVYSASPIVADGRIYAVSEQGIVSVCSAADSSELLGRNQLHARCLATPAIADGELLIRTETELYCIAGNTQGARQAIAVQSVAEKKPSAVDPEVSKFVVQPSRLHAEQAGTPALQVQAANNSWPLFRGDSQATGVAHDDLPEKLDLLWTFSPGQGGFESTAAIADGLVVVGSARDKLYAVDLASGQKRWEFATPAGFSASPALRGGAVYIGDKDGQFYCLDAKSGKLKWKFETEGEIDSSANFYQDNVLFGSQDAILYCLQAQSGKVVWKYESADQIRCFPTLSDRRTFVAGCDGSLHVVDVASGKAVAKVELGGPTGSTPAVMGDMAFVGNEDGTFYGIDWKRAQVVWHYRSAANSAPFRSSAAVTPGAVIVGSRDKTLYAFDPQSDRRLWTFVTKSRVDSSPVVVGTRVFVGSADGRLYGIDLKTGKELWRFEAGGAVVASPAVAAGRLVIGTEGGDLYCFGAKAGG